MEITTLWEQLSSNLYPKEKFTILPLHSSLSTDDQRRIFLRPKEGVRKHPFFHAVFALF
jgi:HrpA-like RNA helicase